MERKEGALPLAEVYLGRQALENHLLQLDFSHHGVDRNRLLPVAALPQNFRAEGIEHFANDLSRATQSDSAHHFERGGWVHLQRTPKKLLYPVTPTVGTMAQEVDQNTGLT